jgi:hypothetical protein
VRQLGQSGASFMGRGVAFAVKVDTAVQCELARFFLRLCGFV